MNVLFCPTVYVLHGKMRDDSFIDTCFIFLFTDLIPLRQSLPLALETNFILKISINLNAQARFSRNFFHS